MNDRPLILLAEAEEAVRESIEMILVDEGYDCHSVSDTPSLLRAMDIHNSALVIADIQLIYNDIDAILQALHHYGSPAPLLVTLSYERIRDMLFLMKFGITEYVVKPFLFEEILERVSKMSNPNRDMHMK